MESTEDFLEEAYSGLKLILGAPAGSTGGSELGQEAMPSYLVTKERPVIKGQLLFKWVIILWP